MQLLMLQLSACLCFVARALVSHGSERFGTGHGKRPTLAIGPDRPVPQKAVAYFPFLGMLEVAAEAPTRLQQVDRAGALAEIPLPV